MSAHRYRGQWRDDVAVWICNRILRTLATRRYRVTLDTVVRQGLLRKWPEPTAKRKMGHRG